MRSVLGGEVAVPACCTSVAWPSIMVSSVTLASAPYPGLPGSEGEQSPSSGHGATDTPKPSGPVLPSLGGARSVSPLRRVTEPALAVFALLVQAYRDGRDVLWPGDQAIFGAGPASGAGTGTGRSRPGGHLVATRMWLSWWNARPARRGLQPQLLTRG